MDLYKGMKMLTFVSFTLGVSTFVVSGWTFITNRISDSDSQPDLPLCNTTGYANGTEPKIISTIFKTTVLRSCVVVVLITVIQIASAAVILGSAVQGCRRRTQFWFGINLGVNLVLLISLVVPMMYAEENKSRLHLWGTGHVQVEGSCQDGHVLHLASFYVALCFNFVIHFLTLIMSLMMLRFDENRDYELVAIV